MLSDYRETLEPNSPNVRLLEPLSNTQPYYVQYGWTAATGETVKLPDNDTRLDRVGRHADRRAAGHAVLGQRRGPDLPDRICRSTTTTCSSVSQAVKNATGAPVKLFPWSRIRRDYTPEIAGYYILFEGLLGVVDGTLQETTYSKAKSEGEEEARRRLRRQRRPAAGRGITDKYWLTALVPDQSVPSKLAFTPYRRGRRPLPGRLHHARIRRRSRPARDASLPSHLFAGAKVVHLLDHYEAEYHIPNFDKAVDFGWFYFLTKPIFFALDWLNGLLGNFGLAIMAFTVCVKRCSSRWPTTPTAR